MTVHVFQFRVSVTSARHGRVSHLWLTELSYQTKHRYSRLRSERVQMHMFMLCVHFVQAWTFSEHGENRSSALEASGCLSHPSALRACVASLHIMQPHSSTKMHFTPMVSSVVLRFPQNAFFTKKHDRAATHRKFICMSDGVLAVLRRRI